MPQYRKKPVVIEAFQLTYAMAKSKEPVPIWFAQACIDKNVKVHVTDKMDGSQYCEIATREGVLISSLNDYIIQGVAGEIYPCKPEIFAATYEVVEEE